MKNRVESVKTSNEVDERIAELRKKLDEFDKNTDLERSEITKELQHELDKHKAKRTKEFKNLIKEHEELYDKEYKFEVKIPATLVFNMLYDGWGSQYSVRAEVKGALNKLLKDETRDVCSDIGEIVFKKEINEMEAEKKRLEEIEKILDENDVDY